MTLLNNWYYVKCANAGELGKNTLLIKYFQEGNFKYIFKGAESGGDGSSSNCYGKQYFEPDDYITLWFEGFN